MTVVYARFLSSAVSASLADSEPGLESHSDVPMDLKGPVLRAVSKGKFVGWRRATEGWLNVSFLKCHKLGSSGLILASNSEIFAGAVGAKSSLELISAYDPKLSELLDLSQESIVSMRPIRTIVTFIIQREDFGVLFFLRFVSRFPPPLPSSPPRECLGKASYTSHAD